MMDLSWTIFWAAMSGFIAGVVTITLCVLNEDVWAALVGIIYFCLLELYSQWIKQCYREQIKKLFPVETTT